MSKKKNKRALARGTLNDVERDLLEGFHELVSDLKCGELRAKKYTRHRLVLDLRPSEYGPSEVQATRRILQASQSLFAHFLGVSPKTVRGWESGKRVGGMASRFMDEIRRDPKYWRSRLRDAVKPKPRTITAAGAKAGKSG